MKITLISTVTSFQVLFPVAPRPFFPSPTLLKISESEIGTIKKNEDYDSLMEFFPEHFTNRFPSVQFISGMFLN